MLIEYRSTGGHALELAANGRLLPVVVETRVQDIRRNLESRGCPAELVERVCAAQLRKADPSTLTLDEIKQRAEQIGQQIKAESQDSSTDAVREANRWLNGGSR